MYKPLVEGQTVRTGKVRLSYAKLFTQDTISNPPKYGTTILIPKTDTETLNCLQAAVMAAGASKWGAEFATEMVPKKKVQLPFRDGDDPDGDHDDAYKGHYFLTARNTNKPPVVSRSMTPIGPEGIKSGDYAVVTIYMHPFTKPQNGISVLLNAVQLVEVGEALSQGGDPMALLEMQPDAGGAKPAAPGSFAGMI